MVLVRRYNKRAPGRGRRGEASKKGRKTQRKRWQAWYDSLSEEVKAQQPLPPGREKDEAPL